MLQYEKNIKRNIDNKLWARNVRHKLKVRNRNRSRQGFSKMLRKEQNEIKKMFWNYRKICAPANFSLIQNSDEVLRFINKLTSAYKQRKKVFVQLKNVKSISGDAVVLLLSNVIQFRSARIAFNGDKPKDEKVAKTIDDSGFFDILYGKYYDEDEYKIKSKNIFTHAKKNVDSELTANLISESASFLWGEERRCTGVQRIFLELMQNTNNHASHTIGDKFWWICVTKKYNPKRVCFSFIDYGMGIFNSLESKEPNDKFFGWMEKIKDFCNPQQHYNVLHEMLTGKFHHTVTGHYFRGKGIPGIYNEIKKESISKLIIISNDAFADPIIEDYHSLRYSLEGTFVYWEIDCDCRNLKNNSDENI